MQEIHSDVITLSSDDEQEGPPSKIMKLNSDNVLSRNSQKALQKLTALKEITTFTESTEAKNKSKDCIQDNSLTIIIDSSTVTSSTTENKVVVDSSNIVVIDEEPSLENSFKSDENVNNISTIIVDDPSEESGDLADSVDISELSVQQNDTEVKEQQANFQFDEAPSTSTASEAHKLLNQFLTVCSKSIRGSKYETRLLDKFPKIKKHFNNCERLHNEVSLKRTLEDHTRIAQFSAADAVVSFQRLYSYLLDNLHGASVEISEENLEKIKKLEKTCKKLLKKIKELENSEINFDDDADSTYIQIDRYCTRLNQVYTKYCQLLNKNPHSGRLLYEKVRFVSSKYNEINRAITKAYKHNKFPTYFDVEMCIKKCVNEHNMSLSENEIKEESKHCFTKLGNLLQLRRKKELYEVHSNFITLNEDPASNDPDLKKKLEESLSKGEEKMKEIVAQYVNLQEKNVNPELSEDSDDSHHQNSDSDREQL